MNERAGDLAARRAQAVRERLPILAGEEALFEAHIEVVPRQARVHRDRAEVALGFDAVLFERCVPGVELELLVPRVEARAGLVSVLDHVAQRAVAARDHAFEPAALGVVHLEAHVAVARALPEHLLLALHGLMAVHLAPLERGVRLGHVGAHADHHARLLADQTAADRRCLQARLDDAEHVFVLFGGQADHEVELHVREVAW